MGLDMYLSAKLYTGKYEHPEIADAIRKACGVDHKLNLESAQVKLEAAYWRKANQIHNWFVRTVQNSKDACEPHPVSRTQLVALRAACEDAINTKDPFILPPKAGFFFGSTEVDEYYWADLHDTVSQIDKVLKAFPEDEGWEFEYQSSW